MVEQNERLDAIFTSLADPTRRDILERVAKRELSVGEIASPYRLTFAAISKHLMVLERAKLIAKHREGKRQMVRVAPGALKAADAYVRRFQVVWEKRLDRLDRFLTKQK